MFTPSTKDSFQKCVEKSVPPPKNQQPQTKKSYTKHPSLLKGYADKMHPVPRHLPYVIRLILRGIPQNRYSVRVLLIDLQSTSEYFIHVRPESEGGNIKYNHDAHPLNPSPNDSSPEYPRRDGTHIIFPFDLDESIASDESSEGPPSFDSNGNEHLYNSQSMNKENCPPLTEVPPPQEGQLLTPSQDVPIKMKRVHNHTRPVLPHPCSINVLPSPTNKWSETSHPIKADILGYHDATISHMHYFFHNDRGVAHTGIRRQHNCLHCL